MLSLGELAGTGSVPSLLQGKAGAALPPRWGQHKLQCFWCGKPWGAKQCL